MRAFLATLAVVVCLLPMVSGCDSGVSKEELGTVQFEVPKVPRADKPYAMPKLGPPPPDAEGSLGPP